MKKRKFIIIFIVILLLSNTKVKSETNKEKYDILVDTNEFKLYLVDKPTRKVVNSYPVTVGKKNTPSPIGSWKVVNKSKDWGSGFGTRWIQINCPWGTYGIHGTNKPSAISRAQSHGCIRMLNKDVEEIYPLIDYDTIVVVYGGPYGLSSNSFRRLKPGDRGSDVLEVQRKLKDKGYYSGNLDGVYGEDMKSQVIKFKNDNKLNHTHYINKDFYNALDMIPFE